jgi:hypothetical protein
LGWPFGEEIVSKSLKQLQGEVDTYFGAINQRLAGLTVQLPEKPEALVLTEMVQETGLPLVPGGLLDQPYIWLKEYRVCVTSKNVFDRIRENSERRKQQQLLEQSQQRG